jgi:hypothetical protein
VKVDDLRGEASASRARGAALDKEPHDTPYGMREMEVLDADGHRICLAQPIP